MIIMMICNIKSNRNITIHDINAENELSERTHQIVQTLILQHTESLYSIDKINLHNADYYAHRMADDKIRHHKEK